jgi:hypothetical protein
MDVVNERLKWLRADLESTIDGKARAELRHKIAFAEAIVRMRDGRACGEGSPEPVVP